MRRVAGCSLIPVAGLVGCLLAGCPNLDQLGPANGGRSDDDAGNLEGGPTPQRDGGPIAPGPDGGLVGAWDFEGTGKVAEDLSGNDHPAELGGAATQTADAGVRGGALVLSGLDSAIVPSLADSAFPRTGTLALWLRYEADKATGFSVFDGFDSARNHFFVRQRPRSEGTLQVGFQVTPDNGEYAWENSFSSAATTWTHIAVAWDAGTHHAKLWVDGVSLHDADFMRPFTTDEQHLVLGDELTGAIDEVRIYRVVLTDTEIKVLAKRP